MDATEQKALDDILEHGCHVLHVLEEASLPPFSYTIGIYKTSGVPEVVLIGLKQEIAHWVVNEYNRRVRAGEMFRAGETHIGFLDGFSVTFREIDKTQYAEYLGWGRWLYRGDDFPALQMVWPSKTGHWPWDDQASSWYRSRQPMLDAPAAPAS